MGTGGSHAGPCRRTLPSCGTGGRRLSTDSSSSSPDWSSGSRQRSNGSRPGGTSHHSAAPGDSSCLDPPDPVRHRHHRHRVDIGVTTTGGTLLHRRWTTRSGGSSRTGRGVSRWDTGSLGAGGVGVGASGTVSHSLERTGPPHVFTLPGRSRPHRTPSNRRFPVSSLPPEPSGTPEGSRRGSVFTRTRETLKESCTRPEDCTTYRAVTRNGGTNRY